MKNPKRTTQPKQKELNWLYTGFFLFVLMAFLTDSGYSQKLKSKELVYDTINMVTENDNLRLNVVFTAGKSHNHPTFAIWMEDKLGNYLETLFVTQYFGTGIYGYRDAGDGTWKNEKGESLRPAALPYWAHKRNVISRTELYIPTPENPVADAITGATPKGNFVLETNPKSKHTGSFVVFFEINQTWDWNEFWTNNKYPDNKDYKSSAQPSLIYAVEVDPTKTYQTYTFKPIGHGHYAGSDGKLYNDLSTLTTALDITGNLVLTLTKNE